MNINYQNLDPKIRKTVEIIESKPHVRWIRYLLTKRYSPIEIKRELQRLGLSAPHEKPLTVYYLTVIDPLVKKHGLGPYYADYKRKLLSEKNPKGAYSGYLLKYRLEFDGDQDGQIKFCKFLQELEIESCWISELLKMYGSAANIPVDEDGNRIIKGGLYKRSLDKLLMHPKRYLVDKMILENVPNGRIAEYVNKNLEGLRLFDYDISYYKSIFFNMRTYDIEEKIRALDVEKNNLSTMLDSLSNDDEMELGEKTLIMTKTKDRISELEDNIKMLNALYSESTIRSMEMEKLNLEEIFLDIVQRGYKRFAKLDNYQDRDVVDPLFKVARMMGYAYEKATEVKINGQTTDQGKDKHSQAELMNLYRDRVDEAYQEQQDFQELNKVGSKLLEDLNTGEILGLEELDVLAVDEE